jgi:hypothetical protein
MRKQIPNVPRLNAMHLNSPFESEIILRFANESTWTEPEGMKDFGRMVGFSRQGAMDLAQALIDTVTQYDDALRNLGEGPQGDAE